jgi:hypothetical protein
VIVLDHHFVLQIQAMNRTPAGNDSGDIKRAQSGRGLSGMENTAPGSLDRPDERTGSGGDSGRPLQEVQERAFGAENVPELSTDPADHRTGPSGATFNGLPFHDAPAGSGYCLGVHSTCQNPTAPMFDPSLCQQPAGHREGAGQVGPAVLGKRLRCNPLDV